VHSSNHSISLKLGISRALVSHISRQTVMFSATFPKPIQQLAKDFLNNHIHMKVGHGAKAKIAQTIKNVPESKKLETLIEDLESESGLIIGMIFSNHSSPFSVFVETKKTASFLEEKLEKRKFSVVAIHGEKTQKEREEAYFSFKNGKSRILIATDVASRGLDILVDFDI
jgi:superfamily II DNA/RNA helicase